MRYLFTPDATKKQGGKEFTPVTRVAGQLYGTLAVENAAADAILNAGGKWVQEITKEDFEIYESRRVEFLKAKNEFKMPDLSINAAPKAKTPAPRVSTTVADVLKPKKV